MKNLSSQPTHSQILCLQGGMVIDPGHVNKRADVLIQNGKIIEIGHLLNMLLQKTLL